MKDARDIIVRPVITEKSMNLMAENKYTFIVDKQANKTEIRKAIEEIFHVKVDNVRTINVKGKKRRMGRFEGYKPDRKKAIVTLKAGHKIPLFEGM
ncbi:MAG TPA: 50S ribosomal protein L23 [Syntrophothermus lipocalidus]|uniref:Large ribosomal subunit protein uL23 n=1 Tax=Syntrophothermus lipocalidus (strain DSM 12680 / TGB-C1) TaxID=643648 RepID=D7CJM1_SYNLT|nr:MULTISPECIES: 50S ribosomal protein L23 [Syntrophothermus]ADI02976.1 Ribosomal protein L25/L23 [Syntrophothermus lipocalidus DSM 12680]NSW82693.1 50S ribosomal protein L23 [Syntrophothermus sp.]HHV77827.1 50S ribosomal protein L23 [Syntrophothermus lipocalidus]